MYNHLRINIEEILFFMKTRFEQTTVTLEDGIFKNSIYVGIFVISLILIYDLFITGDYLSVFIECFALIYFLINLRILLRKKSSARHRVFFSLVLFIIINSAWVTGGGISILLAAVLFLGVEFILVVNDVKNYRAIVLVLIVNYIILFSLEYFFQFNLSPDYEIQKGSLVKQFTVVFLLLFIGGYFTVFLKCKYNKERIKISHANQLLTEKSEEIISSNEELKASEEALGKTIDMLDIQKKELIEIKYSLEDKVRKRTNDLLNMNERLLSQNQQLEQYAYITSHNLRAPIARIKGLVNLLPMEADFDEPTKEILSHLEESTERMENVFSDLSTILNVKNNMQKAWDKVDFVNEIDKVIYSLKPSIKEKNIKIELPKMDAFQVKALQPYVYSIFHNIIENAIKYSDISKVNPYVKIELSDTKKYYLASVKDNGIGIDMEKASGKIFRMYQRFNNTHPGQGFGLFLVKSQVEAMGGKVELESNLGQGTSFNLYFRK